MAPFITAKADGTKVRETKVRETRTGGALVIAPEVRRSEPWRLEWCADMGHECGRKTPTQSEAITAVQTVE
jgi:hypothetical protein